MATVSSKSAPFSLLLPCNFQPTKNNQAFLRVYLFSVVVAPVLVFFTFYGPSSLRIFDRIYVAFNLSTYADSERIMNIFL